MLPLVFFFLKDDTSVTNIYKPVILSDYVSKVWKVSVLLMSISGFKAIRFDFLPGHLTVFQLFKTYHISFFNFFKGLLKFNYFVRYSVIYQRPLINYCIGIYSFKLQTYGSSYNLLEWLCNCLCKKKPKNQKNNVQRRAFSEFIINFR